MWKTRTVSGLVHTAAIAAACLVAVLVFASEILGGGISAQAVACGGTRNAVEAEVDLERGSDIWRVFPAMLRAPELEQETGPVHVVVFKGKVDISKMLVGRPSNVPPVADAICVTTGSGEVFFYDSVSRAGSPYQ